MVKCRKCYAELDDNLEVCPYCGQKLPKFPAAIEFLANTNDGLNSKGGKIIITPTQLIYHPHAWNFGSTDELVFEIKDIVGYKRGLFTYFTILFSGGRKLSLAAWSKSEIIRQLDMRRKA